MDRPRTRLYRLSLLVTATLALALPAGALAGSGNPIVDSLVKTGKVKTVHSRIEVRVSSPALPTPLSVAMDSVVNTQTQEGEVSIDLGALLALFGGPKQPVAIRVRLVHESGGLVAYASYGNSALTGQALPPGKHWVRASAKDLPKSGSLDLGSLAQTSAPDQFARLADVTGKATLVGREPVGGVATTHYRTTIDYGKLATLHPELKKTLLGLVGTSAAAAPMDVWIDGSALMRRLRLSVSVKSGGQTGTTTFTVTSSDFGEPVDIQAPPASEVVDVSSLKKK